MVMDRTLRFYSSEDVPIQGDAPVSSLGKDPTIYLRGNAITFVQKKRKANELETSIVIHYKGPEGTAETVAPPGLPVSRHKEGLSRDSKRLEALFRHVAPPRFLDDGGERLSDAILLSEDTTVTVLPGQTAGGMKAKVKQEPGEDRVGMTV